MIYNIIFIGDEGVGKTSIQKVLKNQNSESYIMYNTLCCYE